MNAPTPATPAAPLAPFLAEAVPGWLAARRYSVPASMVAAATTRREAGDWRGACAAARFEVQVDLDDVRNRYGATVARAVDGDLRHLAPDLVRWHLPREHSGGMGRVLPDLPIVLAWYGPRALWIHTPAHLERPLRPRLRFGPLDRAEESVEGERWDVARDLWDARESDRLRERLGNGGGRTPFHSPDGRRLNADELPSTRPGPDDPAGLVEWVTLLLDAERTDDAWAAAGIESDLLPRDDEYGFMTRVLLVQRNPAVLSVAAEVRHRLATGDGADTFTLLTNRSWEDLTVVRATPDAVTATLAKGSAAPRSTRLPRVAWQRFPDLELLRLGRLEPRHLHPLVRTALFPDSADGEYRPDATVDAPDAVKVRCRGVWHRVGWRNGRVVARDHAPDEARRERTMHALGGTLPRCFQVTEAWSGDRPGTEVGRLPRRLRDLRRDALALVEHGDTDGFLALLDRGVDPNGVRNRRHRNPLHLVAHLDDPGFVGRLVEAGIAVDSTDAWDRTPLGTVLFDGGSAALVRALLDAGADPTHVDAQGCSPLHLLRCTEAATILPWLLDAGLDLEATDAYSRTPLMVQATSLAPPEVLRAMLDAGADPHVDSDDIEDSLDDTLGRYRYDDVGFVPRGQSG